MHLLHKIIFVFRNEDFYLTVKENTTIKSLRLSISKLLNIDINQISMVYEEKEIDISNDEKTVELYFNIKKNDVNIRFKNLMDIYNNLYQKKAFN